MTPVTPPSPLSPCDNYAFAAKKGHEDVVPDFVIDRAVSAGDVISTLFRFYVCCRQPLQLWHRMYRLVKLERVDLVKVIIDAQPSSPPSPTSSLTWLTRSAEVVKVCTDEEKMALLTGCVEFGNTTAWYEGGRLHRDDGHAAVITANVPCKQYEWWVKGSKVAQYSQGVLSKTFVVYPSTYARYVRRLLLDAHTIFPEHHQKHWSKHVTQLDWEARRHALTIPEFADSPSLMAML